MVAYPTQRWYPLRPHVEQRRLWTSPARFRVAACGRRSGKSELAKRMGTRWAIAPQLYPDAQYIFGGPTWQQSKRVFWSDLKRLTPRWALLGQDPKAAISEGELSIRLASGATIQVVGLDRPQRAEGTPIDWLCIDEAADVREEAWTEHLRPGLSERGGEAWIIGTPEGRNHFWRWAQHAQECTDGLWDFFTWPSSDILDPQEVAVAQAELDERTYRQEFQADFLDPSGQVYYNFRRELHVVEKLEYNPAEPLLVGLDFNISPGTAVFCQERLYNGSNFGVDRDKPVTCVVGELWIERDSNTERVCRDIIQRYQNHQSDVVFYGDASGGAKHTSQTDGSDWTIVRKCLEPVFGQKPYQYSRLKFQVSRVNPPVRSRINSLNSRLQSADGKVHLLADPRCRHTIEDLEGVTWGGNGDIDKKTAPMLSHISDALGYLVHKRHPLSEVVTRITQLY